MASVAYSQETGDTTVLQNLLDARDPTDPDVIAFRNTIEGQPLPPVTSTAPAEPTLPPARQTYAAPLANIRQRLIRHRRTSCTSARRQHEPWRQSTSPFRLERRSRLRPMASSKSPPFADVGEKPSSSATQTVRPQALLTSTRST